MTTESDERLWAAVVTAQRELNRAQADFYQHADDCATALRAALARSGWDQTAALGYLYDLSRETLALLPELVDLAVSDTTHAWACDAIGRRRGAAMSAALEPIIAERLDREDEFEYNCLASLLGRIEAWDQLRALIQRAMRSQQPKIAAVGGSFDELYPFLRS